MGCHVMGCDGMGWDENAMQPGKDKKTTESQCHSKTLEISSPMRDATLGCKKNKTAESHCHSKTLEMSSPMRDATVKCNRHYDHKEPVSHKHP